MALPTTQELSQRFFQPSHTHMHVGPFVYRRIISNLSSMEMATRWEMLPMDTAAAENPP